MVRLSSGIRLNLSDTVLKSYIITEIPLPISTIIPKFMKNASRTVYQRIGVTRRIEG